ncbi:MAG: DUF3145 family protein [Acidobacteriota bacterium]|jgi:hypothetical protein|nr:DUF3145 family protein [Acidobacteriota bacterium]
MERLTTPSHRQQVRGFLSIHSAPSALRHHIDWAIQGVLGNWIKLSWNPQPIMPGSFRTQLEFRAPSGTASEIASVLRSWHYLNFEIIEGNENGGELFRFTPELGIHRSIVDQSGAVLVNENQLSSILASSFDEESIRDGIAALMGNSWETELERFRSVDLQELPRLHAI